MTFVSSAPAATKEVAGRGADCSICVSCLMVTAGLLWRYAHELHAHQADANRPAHALLILHPRGILSPFLYADGSMGTRPYLYGRSERLSTPIADD